MNYSNRNVHYLDNIHIHKNSQDSVIGFHSPTATKPGKNYHQQISGTGSTSALYLHSFQNTKYVAHTIQYMLVGCMFKLQ